MNLQKFTFLIVKYIKRVQEIHLNKRIYYLKKYSDKNSIVLDAGSGEFNFTKYASEFNNQVFCSDIIRPSLNNQSKYNFIQSSIESLPFAENSFDFIYCFSVLQYMVNEEVAMGEFYRVLKPGGKLLITVPTALSPFRLLRDLEIRFGVYDRVYIPAFPVKVYHYYTKNRIKKIMADHFRQVEIVGYIYNFVPRFVLFIFFSLYKVINFLRLSYFIKLVKNSISKPTKYKGQEQKSENENHICPKCKIKIGKGQNVGTTRPCFINDLSYHYIIVLEKK